MLLKTLSELNGVAGAEKPIRNALRSAIEPYVDSITVDKIGNLIAVKNGHLKGPKVLVAAHMDEVGLMITEMTTDGFLKFQPVGGIDARVLISKPIHIGKLTGVIGAKAIHLQKSFERQHALSLDQLYIDIGAKSKEEASKHVKLGDYAYFLTSFEPFGEGFYKGKAFDDRVGCSILVELLKNTYDFPIIAAFTVQEEVGLRGAKVAAFHTQPDFALILEGTVSADMMEIEDHAWVTEIGKGPACSIMDRTTLYNPKLIKRVAEIAREKDIPLQFRRGNSGGNDAGKIHLTKTGIPVISISVPCRYIHSYASVVSECDIHNTTRLADEVLKYIPAEIYPNG